MREKLRKIIEDSSFSKADKAIWQNFISVSREEILKILAEEIKSDPRCLAYLSGNIKDKITSLINSDQLLWDKIVAEEKRFLGEA